MPRRRVLYRAFWVKWRSVIGYLIGAVAVAVLWNGQRDINHKVQTQIKLGANSHHVLCEIKGGLVAHIAANKATLAVETGQTRQQTASTLKGQESTLRAIRDLRC